jgi:hypothetical protein
VVDGDIEIATVHSISRAAAKGLDEIVEMYDREINSQ